MPIRLIQLARFLLVLGVYESFLIQAAGSDSVTIPDLVASSFEEKQAASRQFWSFKPLKETQPPPVKNEAWVRSTIDRFILARLEENGLEPAPPASRRALVRRAAFDLTGLPPTTREIDAFLADESPEAFAKVVDRLLASPRYGERWGRHWLDVARYADSNGQDENKAIANAYRYRDYVIQSFNRDKPYDRFVQEQLAGDLLPASSEEETYEQWTGTGFLVLGPKMLAEQDKPKLIMDVVDEQIDVVSRAFLGLTVSCARCHDHKHEPISTRDYYALAGIFKSTKTMANLDFVSKWNERPLANPEWLARFEAHPKKVEANRQALDAQIQSANSELVAAWRKDFSRYLLASTPRRLEAAPDWKDGLNAAILAQWQAHLEKTERDPNSAFFVWHVVAGVPESKFSETFSWIMKRMPRDRWTDPSVFVASQLRNSPAGSLTELAARYDDIFAEAERQPEGPIVKLGPGQAGRGLLCDGKTFLEVPHAEELEPEQLTLEVWVHVAGFPAQGDKRRWLVSKNKNELTDGHFGLVLNGDQPGAYLNAGGGKASLHSVWSAGETLATNRWHHLVMSYDGADLKLYVNGSRAGLTPAGKTRTPGAGPLAVGARPDRFVHFTGHLDEVRLYGRALSEAEIKARFDHSDQQVTDQIRHWDFNELDRGQQIALAQSELRSVLYGTNGLFALPKNARDYYSPETLSKLERLEHEREELETSAPPEPRLALCVAEGTVADTPVHIRGSHLTLEEELVERGFPEAIGGLPVPEIPAGQSGRLQLAQWLTHPDHPLTSRVMANRLWQWHFGHGLVRSPDNFGFRGEPPTHPELLDWLAAEFIRQGWSLKRMHQLLMLSSAYQMSTAFQEKAARRDPENRLWWRMNRRRLDAEEVRDALLFAGGRLDFQTGGTLVTTKNNEYIRFKEYDSALRSVYLPIVRDRVYDVLTIFDFANPSVTTSERVPTVVAHQALFFMNSPLAKAQAQALARRVEKHGSRAARIQQAYAIALGRPASSHEIERGSAFLDQAKELLIQERLEPSTEPGSSASGDPPAAWDHLCQTILASNEFLYVD